MIHQGPKEVSTTGSYPILQKLATKLLQIEVLYSVQQPSLKMTRGSCCKSGKSEYSPPARSLTPNGMSFAIPSHLIGRVQLPY